MARCDRCNGTGWASAARDSGMEDMPLMLRPIGVYRCDNCNGRGDTDPFAHLTDEQRAELDEAIKRAWEEFVARRTALHNAGVTGAELAERPC